MVVQLRKLNAQGRVVEVEVTLQEVCVRGQTVCQGEGEWANRMLPNGSVLVLE